MTYPNYINRGDKFNHLTFIEFTNRKSGCWWALFECECGKIKEYRAYHVKNGHTRSCGCTAKTKNTRHGHSVGNRCSKTYYAWSAMKKRCLNQNHKNYANYGGRGISVCSRWMEFDNFLSDMGEKPDGLSLDRVNNNGNYEPSNCRWASTKVQNNNKRGNTILLFNGESRTIAGWSEITGIKDCTISERLRRGWSVEKTLTTPMASLPRSKHGI